MSKINIEFIERYNISPENQLKIEECCKKHPDAYDKLYKLDMDLVVKYKIPIDKALDYEYYPENIIKNKKDKLRIQIKTPLLPKNDGRTKEERNKKKTNTYEKTVIEKANDDEEKHNELSYLSERFFYID